jgi:HEAT repeat protein
MPKKKKETMEGNRQIIIELLRHLTGGPTLESYNDRINEIKSLDRKLTIEILESLLSDANDDLRTHAGEVLLQIDAKETLVSVLRLLKDPSETTRYNITDWLTLYPDERALESLIEVLMNDPDPSVRANAAVALGEIKNPRAIPALEWVVAHDFESNFDGEAVSSIANGMLARIRNPSNSP